MSREAFDIEAALDKCHKGTAWQRDLIRAQLIAAQADAYERAVEIVRQWDADSPAAEAIRALAKESA